MTLHSVTNPSRVRKGKFKRYAKLDIEKGETIIRSSDLVPTRADRSLTVRAEATCRADGRIIGAWYFTIDYVRYTSKFAHIKRGT